MSQHALARAKLSLDGLSLGDSLGGFFEMSSMSRMINVIHERRLPAEWLKRREPLPDWAFRDE